MREHLEKAYLLGFMRSGEGYNAEYPFKQKGIDPKRDTGMLKSMERALDELERQIAAIVADPNRPRVPGHYWGRWHTVSPGTKDGEEACLGTEWEVHQVFENCIDATDPEYLMVAVPGVEKAQALNAFEWGEQVTR